jgi:hypothetical protein
MGRHKCRNRLVCKARGKYKEALCKGCRELFGCAVDTGTDICPVCIRDDQQCALLPVCGHGICLECIQHYLAHPHSSACKACPRCTKDINSHNGPPQDDRPGEMNSMAWGSVLFVALLLLIVSLPFARKTPAQIQAETELHPMMLMLPVLFTMIVGVFFQAAHAYHIQRARARHN